MIDQIRQPVGATFDVELEAVPTAGFRWTLTGSGGGPVVQLVDSAVTPGAAVGGRARQRFTFRAVSAGTTTLTFSYGRSWDREPRRAHQVHVTIG